MYYGIKAG